LSVNKGGKSGGPGYVNGLYRTINEFSSILNHNLNINYVNNLTDKISLSVDAGLDSRKDEYNQSGLRSTQQIVFGLFDHSNFITHDILSEGGNDLDYKIQEIRIGAYAQAVLGYADYLYLTLNGRNDWVSTLEAKNRHLFYPGISASFIPTSFWGALKNSSAINYLKLRLGYSTSAHFPSPYNTRPSLDIVTNAFVDRNGNVINTGAIPDNVPNPDLKPELLRETEAGIEGKFLNNRLSLDLTGYSRTATDQILSRQLDASTGYTTTTINAGSIDNKGIELSLGYVIVSSSSWKWELTGLFTLNRNRVHDMPSDIKQIQTGGYTGQVGTYAVNGEPLGVIKGTYIQKDPKSGLYIVDNNGYYLQSADNAVIGDPNPKYKLTGISNLSYKDFSFHMQWDYTQGGQIYSNTVRTMLSRGVTRDTDFDRSLPYVLPHTVKQDGTPNDIQQSVDNIYFNSFGFGPDQTGIYDATLIRLRELSISYMIPANRLKNTPFGSASITVTGNNIWYLAPHFPKYTHEDPEVNSLGSGPDHGLDLFAGPSSRRIGASIILSF
ncbi:MAG TPA: TonB-dependent receptor, partial [Puia sp.]